MMDSIRTILKPSPKLIGALSLFILGLGLLFVGMPKGEAKLERVRPEVQKTLADRSHHIDPGELLQLMYNNQLHLFIIDVRNEADFNLFHLKDAVHRPIERMTPECCQKLKAEGVKVVVSNDEKLAERAYHHLVANQVLNVYILAGGINLWLDIFQDGKEPPPHLKIEGDGSDKLRHRFECALGHHHPASLPKQKALANRKFPTKVKVAGPKRVEGGGCG